MPGVFLVRMMALVLAASPDAAGLVARLGSGVFAEREEAARVLEGMGREALPALVAAGDAPDTEVRSRASALWDGIQRSLMVRPTMVRLDGEGLTPAEVARSLGEQAGLSIRISSQVSDRLVNARELAPVPFWEAVDRLGLSGGHFDITNPGGSHFPTLQFGGSGDACPTTISGPFRVKLTGLHDHRDQMLIDGPWLRIDQMNQRIPIRRDAKGREARFFAGLGLMVEPRMWFTQEGPARAIEAVDDLGQSLVPRDGTGGQRARTIFHNGGGVTTGDVELDLAMPDRPGRTIARLRGAVPVALQRRRPRPALDIPLAGASGKTFIHEDATFTVRKAWEGEGGSGIVLQIKLNLDRAELPPGRDGEVVSSRLRSIASHQVEIIDAGGVVLTENASGGWDTDGSGRLTLSAPGKTTKASPARFRYHGMVRAFADVAFEFRNIPMP